MLIQSVFIGNICYYQSRKDKQITNNNTQILRNIEKTTNKIPLM